MTQLSPGGCPRGPPSLSHDRPRAVARACAALSLEEHRASIPGLGAQRRAAADAALADADRASSGEAPQPGALGTEQSNTCDPNRKVRPCALLCSTVNDPQQTRARDEMQAYSRQSAALKPPHDGLFQHLL
jgi:hypothetical protein